MRRWNLLLCVVHASFAVLLIGTEELYHWQYYARLQSIEDSSHSPFNPVLGMEAGQFIDYRLDLRERSLHSMNLPASVAIGWYSHPLSIFHSSLAGPVLLQAFRSLSLKNRVVVLDAILLFAIASQWWLIGLWVEASVPLARLQKGIAASMTLLGAVMTLISLSKPLRQIGLFEGIVDVSSLLVILAWLLMIGVGIVSMATLVTRRMRSPSYA